MQKSILRKGTVESEAKAQLKYANGKSPESKTCLYVRKYFTERTKDNTLRGRRTAHMSAQLQQLRVLVSRGK